MTGAICALAASVAALAAGYALGFQHGHDRAAFDISRETHVIVEPYPYAGACSRMLEEAWAIQPMTPPHD